MKNKSVFDFIDLEDGDASVLLYRLQIQKDSFKARRARDEVMNRIYLENKGLCETCKSKYFVRWVDKEFYICYDCYHEGMKMNGEFYSYHGCRAEDIPGFIYDDEWEELWEEENPHMIYNEEDDEYYDKNIPREVKSKQGKVEDSSIMEAFSVFEKQLGV